MVMLIKKTCNTLGEVKTCHPSLTISKSLTFCSNKTVLFIYSSQSNTKFNNPGMKHDNIVGVGQVPTFAATTSVNVDQHTNAKKQKNLSTE